MEGKCDGCGRIGTVALIPMEGIYCPLCEMMILTGRGNSAGRMEYQETKAIAAMGEAQEV